MFQIGDIIVYPMYGAGVIESIEEKKILKEKHSYYTMRMPIGDMLIMVPVEKSDKAGIRCVVDEKTAKKVINDFDIPIETSDESWNKRYHSNIDKIRTGDIFEVLKVVKSLILRDKLKGLSTGERKLMNNAKMILISELVLALHTSFDELDKKLEQAIDKQKELLFTEKN